MNRIERMLQELCPEGVEYRKLGEVLDYEQPTKYIVKDTGYDDSYQTPVLTAGQSFILGYTNEQNGIYEASKDNPTIIFDDFTCSFHWVDFSFKVKSSAMKMLRPINGKRISFKYVYYAMACIGFIPIDHARHWISKYSLFEIPVPPLPIQEEIVRILDHFTELTASLQAELQARKEQYEYYRNKLFREHQMKVDYKHIGDIMYISDYVSAGSFASIRENVDYLSHPDYAILLRFADFSSNFDRSKFIYVNKHAYDFLHKSNLNPGDIIMSNVGSCGASFSCPDLGQPMTLAPNSIVIKTPNNRFYYHWFQTEMAQKEIAKIKSKSAMPKFNKTDFKKIKVPIPPLSEQQRIVSILDKFETLVNDLSQGLPAEIAAVQEQYEYYRNKLLTFNRIQSN